ncbi:MAG: cell shape determination protein CcmA [Acidobacteria bacterium]|nr:MAG: cell shape determination protein CcmA [Acidobacteriota bacterium]
MWGNKETEPGTPGASPAPGPGIQSTPKNVIEAARPLVTPARPTAWLTAGLKVKGEISGNEDLYIDCTVEGPISLGGHRLTVGRTAETTEQIVAREIVVYGKVNGDLRARDRIEIKKDGSVTGDLVTARIIIEDGAYFKGHIEIDRSNTQVGTDLDSLFSRTISKSD